MKRVFIISLTALLTVAVLVVLMWCLMSLPLGHEAKRIATSAVFPGIAVAMAVIAYLIIKRNNNLPPPPR